MKTRFLNVAGFIAIAILFGCSSEDDDFIVGSWKVTARHNAVTNEELPLNDCTPIVAYQFSSDHSMKTYKVKSDPPGVMCGLELYEILKWSKTSDSTYVATYINAPESVAINYKVEGRNLTVQRTGVAIVSTFSKR